MKKIIKLNEKDRKDFNKVLQYLMNREKNVLKRLKNA